MMGDFCRVLQKEDNWPHERKNKFVLYWIVLELNRPFCVNIFHL
jgi:hypothetical protein